jgi:hypothetical protein
MESKIKASNEKAQVLRQNMWASLEEMKVCEKEIKSKIGALVSRMDIHQASTEAWLGEIMAWRKETMAC